MKKIIELLPKNATDDELFVITLTPVSSFKLDAIEVADIDEMSADQLAKMARKLLQNNNQLLVTGKGRIFIGKECEENEI